VKGTNLPSSAVEKFLGDFAIDLVGHLDVKQKKLDNKSRRNMSRNLGILHNWPEFLL